jgi:hypothetical protein
MFFFHKKNPHETSCLVCHVLVCIILFLVVLASLVGAVTAHYNFVENYVVFGTTQGALSLLALAVSLTLWMYQMRACMGSCEMCMTGSKKK